MESKMNNKEKKFFVLFLSVILIMVIFDLVSDYKEGTTYWHLMTEGLMGLMAVIGIFIVLRNSIETKQELKDEREKFSNFKLEAEKWREQSRNYVEGLSQAIDQQLTTWNLSSAEKEVAFLLLKGLSLKDIALVRKTTEKTARAQSAAIYSKSGLSGRSELAAFFLEDLLVPNISL
jgi:DNA-binding CsgD family transcriptional regulator/F0F1-type ATP synthase assembly protein I